MKHEYNLTVYMRYVEAWSAFKFESWDAMMEVANKLMAPDNEQVSFVANRGNVYGCFWTKDVSGVRCEKRVRDESD